MTTPSDPVAALRDALEEEAYDANDDALLARAIEGAMAKLDRASTHATSDRTPARTATLTEVVRPRIELVIAKDDENGDVSATPETETTRSAKVRRIGGRMVRAALPLAAAFVATIAMAAVYVVTRKAANDTTPNYEQSTRMVSPTARPNAPNTLNGSSSPDGEPSTPTISVDDLPSVRAAAAPSASSSGRASGPSSPSSVASENGTSAEELFRNANSERRAGNPKAAVELYSRLLSRFPNAAESRASRVSLGRLLLEREGDAVGAVAQFDAYLASSGDETLAEEARVGRALAFMRLGKREEERRAWQQLMDHHPDSLQSERARQRLEQLGEAGAGSH